MKKLLLSVAVLTAISFASCGKKCTCVYKEDGKKTEKLIYKGFSDEAKKEIKDDCKDSDSWEEKDDNGKTVKYEVKCK